MLHHACEGVRGKAWDVAMNTEDKTIGELLIIARQ